MTNANAAPASEPAIPNPRADIAQLDALERTLYCHRYAIDEIASLGPVIDPARRPPSAARPWPCSSRSASRRSARPRSDRFWTA